MEYLILVTCGAIELSNCVNLHIKDGWKPQGGVSISETARPGCALLKKYAQAMVKVDDKPCCGKHA